MHLRHSLIVLLLSCSVVGCGGLGASSAEISGARNKEVSNVCDEVSRLYKENRLSEVTLVDLSRQSELSQVDLDNDGVDEEVTYRPTRTFAALIEIKDGKDIVIPMGTASEEYNGASVIKVFEHNYVLHRTKNPKSLYELVDLKKPSDDNSFLRYDEEIICNF